MMKRLFLFFCLFTNLFLFFSPAQARQNSTCVGPAPTVKLTVLPPEAKQTLQLIRQGGPFPYRRDGIVFQNREKCLPRQPKGYYHEYTVPTPNSRDRGARRIITGEPDEYYYTEDHYRSFQRIQTP